MALRARTPRCVVSIDLKNLARLGQLKRRRPSTGKDNGTCSAPVPIRHFSPVLLFLSFIRPPELQGVTLKLNSDAVVGNGSFGVVFEAKIVETGETVAIKKVLQDKRFRNRELQIMKQLHHPNIVTLKHYFYQSGEKVRNDRFLPSAYPSAAAGSASCRRICCRST